MMKTSKKFAKVKSYYENGLWSLNVVKAAVEKEWITAEEFEEITGEKYEGAEAEE